MEDIRPPQTWTAQKQWGHPVPPPTTHPLVLPPFSSVLSLLLLSSISPFWHIPCLGLFSLQFPFFMSFVSPPPHSTNPLCSLCSPLCLPLALATPIPWRLWWVWFIHPAERRSTSLPQIQEEDKHPALPCWSQVIVSYERWGKERLLHSSSTTWKRVAVSMEKARQHLHNVWNERDASQIIMNTASVLSLS